MSLKASLDDLSFATKFKTVLLFINFVSYNTENI